MGVETPQQKVDRINREAEAERGPDDPRPVYVAADRIWIGSARQCGPCGPG
jgi:hypothetical protein